MKKYSVGIIGLGNIGMMYDYNDLTDNLYLSHAKSFFKNPSFNIAFLLDNDKNKLELAKIRFGKEVQYLNDIEQIKTLPDVLVLSSLPELNFIFFNIFKDDQRVKLFLIEKPFWSSTINVEHVLQYSEKCYINYFRKYFPFFQKLSTDIKANSFGQPISCHIWYSKGLRNNGSHLIDICNYLFGANFNLNSICITDVISDYIENDPTISFSIKYNMGGKEFPIIFQGANEQFYSIIEIDLLFEKSRYRIFDFSGKIEISQVEADPIFPGYKNLINKKIVDIDISKYGQYMSNYIFDLLEGKQKNSSTLVDEKHTFTVINYIQNRIKKT